MIRQYGAKLLQGLGYLRHFGCLPEGVLAAGQAGSSLVFLFGVIGVDAGRASNHPSIQGQNLTQELSLAVTMQCVVQTPMSSSYGPPKWTARGQPTGSLPGSPSGACWDPLRVLLFFCYSSQAYSPSRGSPWVLLWGRPCELLLGTSWGYVEIQDDTLDGVTDH